MKKLTRPEPPTCWGDDAAACEQRREWYRNLRKKNGKIHDRWNSVDKVDDVSSIRISLREMSDGLCAWCGARLRGSWHVDHWLSQEQFPRLAYHWGNMFPSCASCNLRKQSAKSAPVESDSVIDPILSPITQAERVWRKTSELPAMTDRLIDPEVDDPAEHLEFVPLALKWQPRNGSKLGTATVTALGRLRRSWSTATP